MNNRRRTPEALAAEWGSTYHSKGIIRGEAFRASKRAWCRSAKYGGDKLTNFSVFQGTGSFERPSQKI